jgi:hypothetical protein
LLFHANNGYASTPQYYVIRTLPILLFFTESLLTVQYFTNYKISAVYFSKFWAVQKMGQSAKTEKKGSELFFFLPGRQKT